MSSTRPARATHSARSNLGCPTRSASAGTHSYRAGIRLQSGHNSTWDRAAAEVLTISGSSSIKLIMYCGIFLSLRTAICSFDPRYRHLKDAEHTCIDLRGCYAPVFGAAVEGQMEHIHHSQPHAHQLLTHRQKMDAVVQAERSISEERGEGVDEVCGGDGMGKGVLAFLVHTPFFLQTVCMLLSFGQLDSHRLQTLVGVLPILSTVAENATHTSRFLINIATSPTRCPVLTSQQKLDHLSPFPLRKLPKHHPKSALRWRRVSMERMAGRGKESEMSMRGGVRRGGETGKAESEQKRKEKEWTKHEGTRRREGRKEEERFAEGANRRKWDEKEEEERRRKKEEWRQDVQLKEEDLRKANARQRTNAQEKTAVEAVLHHTSHDRTDTARWSEDEVDSDIGPEPNSHIPIPTSPIAEHSPLNKTDHSHHRRALHPATVPLPSPPKHAPAARLNQETRNRSQSAQPRSTRIKEAGRRKEENSQDRKSGTSTPLTTTVTHSPQSVTRPSYRLSSE
ncbi:hypothetical protein BLNAU_20930 [Blattamonas nauphoetae]|uniref:Uncharacterized protein n=1 Tax=Blattamonas nauphoetae TaxID=2049346 RepID=A0ABQ9WXD3_9EUKA|nr:hypothetical protein BLNAU_20930 [Blattamonas nauphoetae]